MDEPREDYAEPGRRALDAFGMRLALLFLATAAIGLPLTPDQTSWGWILSLVAGLGVCAALVLRGFSEPGSGIGSGRPEPALAATAVVVAVIVVLAASSGDPRSYEVIGWLVAGVAGGVSVARGPAWGLGAYAGAVLLIVITGRVAGAGAPLITLLGPLSFCFGGAAVNLATRRGFASSARALAAAETAQAAQRIAGERWRARRAADRGLHDTVLATLTLLAHGGVGVRTDRLRERCERDVAMLQAQAVPGGGADEPAPTAAGSPSGGGSGWLDELVEQARDDGLSVVLHLDLDLDTGLAPEVRDAVRGAVAECFENVRRHAGTRSAEVTCGRSGRQLVLVVLDGGVGFDPGAVATDRLGLRAGVRDRIAEVGGSVSIWSSPGEGTSIVLRVPLVDEGPDGRPAGQA